jgi:hemolysin III
VNADAATATIFLLIAGTYTAVGGLARWPYATKRPRLAPRVFGYHEMFHLLVIGAAAAHSAVVAGLAA